MSSMKLSTLIILGFLVGCSGAPDSSQETTSTDDTSPSDPGGYEHPGGGGPGACGNAFQQVKVKLPDGSTSFITIPIPCNPNWRDTGDPPPDREKQQIVDPPPDEIIIREQEQQYVR